MGICTPRSFVKLKKISFYAIFSVIVIYLQHILLDNLLHFFIIPPKVDNLKTLNFTQ